MTDELERLRSENAALRREVELWRMQAAIWRDQAYDIIDEQKAMVSRTINTLCGND